MTPLTIDRLGSAVRDDVAIRYVARLQPAGGRGDKIFPPTYAGGQYAIEERIVFVKKDEQGAEQDVLKKVVLLDSVQSQANRMEQTLLAAHRAGRVQLPLVTVDFSTNENLRELGEITVLDAPHRLADAILRDSVLNGTLFPATPDGQILRRSTPRNATELFRLCPTALLFGVWESTGAAGGLGVKFQRCIVSEIIGIGAVVGRKTASRIDPLQIGRVPIYESSVPEGEIRWTADESKAVQDGSNSDGTPKYKRFKMSNRAKGVPSEINHGNVTPDIARHRGERVRLGRDFDGQQRIVSDRDELPGGITVECAKHTAVLSLAALGKLRFPLDGNGDGSTPAHTVLAALGLFALTELRRSDYDLRSRCALVLESAPALEIVKRNGDKEAISLDEPAAQSLLHEALEKLPQGLVWRSDGVRLTPSSSLVSLVEASRSLGSIEEDGEEVAEEDASAAAESEAE